MNKVFLGGTCNESTWRDELIPNIQVNYFNPVVDDWSGIAQAEEKLEKEEYCNIHLYVITSEMSGVYSIAEAIDSAHTKGKQTILHVMPGGFTADQLKSLQAVCKIVRRSGQIAIIKPDLLASARLLNEMYSSMSYESLNLP